MLCSLNVALAIGEGVGGGLMLLSITWEDSVFLLTLFHVIYKSI
jgi:hypothetical protein